MNEKNATVRIYDNELTHVALEFPDPDDALSLYEFFFELYRLNPPPSRVILELSGGPFSFHTREFKPA